MRAVALLAAPLALACSDGPAAPNPGDAPGTFRATFSDAIIDTLTGVTTLAVFPARLRPAYYSVQLYLAPGQSPFWLTIIGDGPRPIVGSYVVTPRTSPQTMPTVNAAKCVDNTVVCDVQWGTHWETPAASGTACRSGRASRLGQSSLPPECPAVARGSRRTDDRAVR